MSQHVPDALPKLVNHACHIWRCDLRPFAVSDVNKAHTLKILHGFPDRRPAHLISHHKVAFGRKCISGAQAFIGDQSKKSVLHLIRQFSLFDWIWFWIGGHARRLICRA